MSYEVTWWGHGSGDVSLTVSGAPVTITTGLDVVDSVSIRLTSTEARKIGASLAEGPGGSATREYLKDSLDDALSLVQTLSDDRDEWQAAATAHAGHAAAARSTLADIAHQAGEPVDEAVAGCWRPESLARVYRAVVKMRDELENLRLTTAEDERHIDRQAAEIERLSDDRANLERERDAAWKSAHAQSEEGGKARGVVADVARVLGVDIDEGDGHRWDEDHMRRIVDAAAELRVELGWFQMADERRSEVLATDVSELRATVVRQANEITELKGERA